MAGCAAGLFAQIRMIPHVTRADGGFQTEVIVANTGGSPANGSLTAFDSAGEALETVEVALGPDETGSDLSSRLFGSDAVAYFTIDGDETLAVTAVYRANRPEAGVAHVSVASRQSQGWRIYAGADEVTWDGAAIVNMGGEATPVRVTHRNAAGEVVATLLLDEELAPGGKLLNVLSETFEPAAGSWYEITACRALAVTALRGNLASDFLWENRAVAFEPLGECGYQLETPFPNLDFNTLTALETPPDGSNRLFAVELFGTVHVFENDSAVEEAEVFINIADRVTSGGGERGMFSIAFHPNFVENGFFYLSYTTPDPTRSIVARYQVSADNPNRGDRDSELILLDMPQPDPRHNGGQIAFGADGYLYVALGDGGLPNDTAMDAQNRTNLLGSLLRIDVDNPAGGLNYGIPADNPYVGNGEGFREEIYAYGFRNPWRFSIDDFEGVQTIWVGDVGAARLEEIDIALPGANYGWSVVEGSLCLQPPQGCNAEGFEPPVWEYGHNAAGGGSVTGGFVYRGSAMPELFGAYLYADFITGNLWALRYDGVNPTENVLLLDAPNFKITSFGRDADGEPYLVTVNGEIWKFDTD